MFEKHRKPAAKVFVKVWGSLQFLWQLYSQRGPHLLSETLSLQAVIFQTLHLLKGYVYGISLAQAGNHWGQIAVQISDRASDSESSCEPQDGS